MILVTGAGGLLGAEIIEKLSDSKESFIPILRGEEFSFDNGRIFMDITNQEHIIKLKELDIKPEKIIHLAGKIDIGFKDHLKSSHLIPANKDTYSLYKANTMGCVNILDYAVIKKIKHIIYASSQTVYGMPKEDEIFTENSKINALEHYAQSKYFGEEILKKGVYEGINITVLRFPGLYSEKHKSGIEYDFVISAIKNKKINIPFNVPIPFDCIHCEDVANAFLKALKYNEVGFNVFNIATGKPNSLNLLAKKISKQFNETVIINNINHPEVIMNSNKAKSILNWKNIDCERRLNSFVEHIKND